MEKKHFILIEPKNDQQISYSDSKIILLGNSSVGKTCIYENYLKKTFPKYTSATVGADFGIKKIEITEKTNDKIINKKRLMIWDTQGEEKFQSVSNLYYRGANAAIIVYDIGNEKSFNNCIEWFNLIRSYSEENKNEIHLVLVGNKLDRIIENPQSRCVPKDAAAKFASKNNIDFFEISALDTEQVNNLFNSIIKKIYQNELIIKEPDENVQNKILLREEIIKLQKFEVNQNNVKKTKKSCFC